MYAGGFYPFATPEEYWAWWSRHIMVNRYDAPVGEPYRDLLNLLEGRDFFVLTTNVDHQFQRAGIDRARLCYLQGDYGLWQCSKPCHRAPTTTRPPCGAWRPSSGTCAFPRSCCRAAPCAARRWP
ncbi:hypothetical protein [Eggerthella sinensis]|uniref:hypothetical protein n=1 Tax=Eggerthella sinensis TaxID=242230 RepID=UPI0022E27A3F|nr:hypothetical protein [Eggerthella sinensis]